MRGLLLFVVLLAATIQSANAQSQIESSKLKAGGVLQGGAAEASKLNATGVLQNTTVQNSKLNATSVFQTAAVRSSKLVGYAVLQMRVNGGVVLRAPLTHW